MTVKRATWGTGESQKVTWAATFYDESGKRHRKQGFDTKRLAETWEQEERQRLVTSALKPAEVEIHITTLCEEWLYASEQGLGERRAIDKGTLADYELSVRLYIKPLIGAALVSALTPPGVIKFRKALLEMTSRKKAQRVLRHLRIALNYAVEIGYIKGNPAQSIKIVADTREDDKVKIPSRIEMNLLLNALEVKVTEETKAEHKDRPWLRFMALFRVLQGAGFRISEARGLAWDSVDLNRGVIAVCQRADKWGLLGPPKSKSAYRQVVVSDAVLDALRKWKPHCAASEHNLVFPSRDGKPLLYGNMYKLWWKPLCRDARLLDENELPKYGFHSARHFRASEKIAVGANVLQVKKEIGHANSATTLDIYGHLFPEDLEKQREQAEEIERKLSGATS